MPSRTELEAVALDEMGGDLAPAATVQGAVEAVEQHGLRVILVGQEAALRRELSRLGRCPDGIEIVDIEPEALENNIECYIRTSVSLVLRQKLAIPLSTFFFSFPLFGMASVTLQPTPNPPVLFNPAIEEDQIKAFITMTVA